MHYLFQLGHQPKVSKEEIFSVLNKTDIKYKLSFQNEGFLILETEEDIDSKKLMTILGGTIKIAREIMGKGSVQDLIVTHLDNAQPEGKIQFAISGNNDFALAKIIKKELKQIGRSVRFIEIKSGASIVFNKLIQKQGDLTKLGEQIFVTEAVQPFEEFSSKDVDRPALDKKSGILPPKLARILINLGGKDITKTILDPFCGSGTLLSEAVSLGFKKIIGNDLSKKAIEDSQKNIDWLLKKTRKDAKIEFILGDVAEIGKKIVKNSVDLIVTEPFMGKPLRGNEKRDMLATQAKELSKLYVQAFKSFHKILTPHAVVVFIFPQFKYQNEWIKTENIDEIKKIGFSVMPFSAEDSLLYHRKGQYLARNIQRFQKK